MFSSLQKFESMHIRICKSADIMVTTVTSVTSHLATPDFTTQETEKPVRLHISNVLIFITKLISVFHVRHSHRMWWRDTKDNKHFLQSPVLF